MDNQTVFMQRAFVNPQRLQKNTQPLGASWSMPRTMNATIGESEIRDGVVINEPSAQRQEVDFQIMKRTQPIGGVMPVMQSISPVYKFR